VWIETYTIDSMTFRLIAITLAAGAALLAQEKPQDAPKIVGKPVAEKAAPNAPGAPQAPPALSPEILKVYFKASAALSQATVQLEAATQQLTQYVTMQTKQAALQEIVGQIRKMCGDKFDVDLSKDPSPDRNGDPTCVAKPTPAPVDAAAGKEVY
jgi:hypothetical protein